MCATSGKTPTQNWDINERIELLTKEFNLAEKQVQRILEILGIFFRPPVIRPKQQIVSDISKESKEEVFT